jgi:hypothetical protein
MVYGMMVPDSSIDPGAARPVFVGSTVVGFAIVCRGVYDLRRHRKMKKPMVLDAGA